MFVIPEGNLRLQLQLQLPLLFYSFLKESAFAVAVGRYPYFLFVIPEGNLRSLALPTLGAGCPDHDSTIVMIGYSQSEPLPHPSQICHLDRSTTTLPCYAVERPASPVTILLLTIPYRACISCGRCSFPFHHHPAENQKNQP